MIAFDIAVAILKESSTRHRLLQEALVAVENDIAGANLTLRPFRRRARRQGDCYTIR